MPKLWGANFRLILFLQILVNHTFLVYLFDETIILNSILSKMAFESYSTRSSIPPKLICWQLGLRRYQNKPLNDGLQRLKSFSLHFRSSNFNIQKWRKTLRSISSDLLVLLYFYLRVNISCCKRSARFLRYQNSCP